MKEKFSLKDHLFNKESVSFLADLFVAGDSSFNKKKFVNEVMMKFPELELKARIGFIAEVLGEHLPNDPRTAMKMIVKALPPKLDPTKTDDDFGSFIFAPLGEYVVRHGCSEKYVQQSLLTLREITMRFSMEDAMRAFLNKFQVETLAQYDKWVSDKNYHVRRLVSESTRPSLPWSQKIAVDYKVPLKYLDTLYSDKTRYVTRSVANHLNDISKKDPALVVATLKRWNKEGKQTESEIAWITKHALRTLVKRGDVGALTLLGFNQMVPIKVHNFSLSKPEYRRGEVITFSSELSSTTETEVMLDYVIDFVKTNGTTKPKVFKLKKLSLTANSRIVVTKNHHLKADATTFKLNPGLHTLTLQINGIQSKSISFTLK
jgi:3-methyladenine DNA glycosylase AlkC